MSKMRYKESHDTCNIMCCDSAKRHIIFIIVFIIVVVVSVPVLVLSLRSPTQNNNISNSSANVNDIPLYNTNPLFVAAFNVKSFGRSKLEDKFILRHLVEIFVRYDIVLVQEIRDKSGQALNKVWKHLNATGSHFGLVFSEQLGRTNYKEQYAFFYRIKTARVTNKLQHTDSLEDIFEREPMTVEFEYFSIVHQALRRVSFMALHTKPADAEAELTELPNAIRLASKYFYLSDGIIAMGDFNADCSYLSNKKKKRLAIFNTNGEFRSLIDNSADTTVASTTDCAYDRIIVYGDNLKVKGASVFDFQDYFELNETQARQISDHFPVEFRLL